MLPDSGCVSATVKALVMVFLFTHLASRGTSFMGTISLMPQKLYLT